MIEEKVNNDLMCNVYRNQVMALQDKVKQVEAEKQILISKLIKVNPELFKWVKLNFGGSNEQQRT